MTDTAQLRLIAAKLRQMWGKNPDSALIEEAADFIDTLNGPAEVEAKEPQTKTSTKRVTKGEVK